jgi:hypothetical protein
MFQDKFVFAQLTDFLDRNHFNYLAKKYGGDKYVKHFTCWNQLLALMFGQLSNRESLRDLIVVTMPLENFITSIDVNRFSLFVLREICSTSVLSGSESCQGM